MIVTPTLAAMPAKNRADGNTVGPSEDNGEPVDPLIGWCRPTRSTSRATRRLDPAGLQIIGRRNADADVLAAQLDL